MRTALWFVLLIGFAFALLGSARTDEPSKNDEPKSEAAKKAKAQYNKDLAELDENYRTLLRKLRAKYAVELDKARKTALEVDDLDEAQRIVKAKKALDEPAPPVAVATARLITFDDFTKIESTYAPKNKRAKNGTAKASSYFQGEGTPGIVFKGYRMFEKTQAWSVSRAANGVGWFEAKWEPAVEGRQILVFGRPTPVGYDPWGKASAKINGGEATLIGGMSGSHVIIFEFKAPTKIQSLRLEMNGRDYPGIRGIEIHP